MIAPAREFSCLERSDVYFPIALYIIFFGSEFRTRQDNVHSGDISSTRSNVQYLFPAIRSEGHCSGKIRPGHGAFEQPMRDPTFKIALRLARDLPPMAPDAATNSDNIALEIQLIAAAGAGERLGDSSAIFLQ